MSTVRTPLVFQQRAIDKALANIRASEGGLYVSFPAGTGKTITGIEICKEARAVSDDYCGPTLVMVAPLVNVDQWRSEIELQDPGVPVEIWRSIDDVRKLSRWEPRWIVTHYDQASRILKVMENWRRQRWASIIADEAHAIKGHATKRTKQAKKMRAPLIVPMSATPMQASAGDLWPALNWMAPTEFPGYVAFTKKFCNVQEGYNGRPVVRGTTTEPEPLAELRTILGRFMIRIKKQDAAPWLPEKIITHVPIEMEPAQRRLYDTVRKSKEALVDLSEHGVLDPLVITNVLSLIVNLQKIALYPPMAGGTMDGSKLEWLDAYIRDNPSEQIVVFSKFRAVAQLVARRHDAALVIGGAAPHKLDAFKAEKVQVLAATIAAGGTGLDLPKPRTAIFMDREWSSILMEQAVERIDRIFGRNNNEPKHIIYLEATRSVDRLVRMRVEQKMGDNAMVYAYMTGDG